MSLACVIPGTASGGGGSSVVSGQRKLAPLHVLTVNEVSTSTANLVGANLAFSEDTTQVWYGGVLLSLGVGGDARFDPVTGNLTWATEELLGRAEVDATIVCEYQVR